jgi:hypothetical protein
VEIIGLHDLLLRVIDFGTDASTGDEETSGVEADRGDIAQESGT